MFRGRKNEEKKSFIRFALSCKLFSKFFFLFPFHLLSNYAAVNFNFYMLRSKQIIKSLNVHHRGGMGEREENFRSKRNPTISVWFFFCFYSIRFRNLIKSVNFFFHVCCIVDFICVMQRSLKDSMKEFAFFSASSMMKNPVKNEKKAKSKMRMHNQAN